MIKHFNEYNNYNEYDEPIFINNTPVVDNDGDVWLYRKIFFYKNKKRSRPSQFFPEPNTDDFFICRLSDLADYDDNSFIIRDDKELYYSADMIINIRKFLKQGPFVEKSLGKTLDEVKNKIDDFYISLKADEFNI